MFPRNVVAFKNFADDSDEEGSVDGGGRIEELTDDSSLGRGTSSSGNEAADNTTDQSTMSVRTAPQAPVPKLKFTFTYTGNPRLLKKSNTGVRTPVQLGLGGWPLPARFQPNAKDFANLPIDVQLQLRDSDIPDFISFQISQAEGNDGHSKEIDELIEGVRTYFRWSWNEMKYRVEMRRDTWEIVSFQKV